jgi:beta-glucosidase
MDIESRINYIIAHTTLAEQIAQLTNDAPQIANLSIPRYNWLNEGIHGPAEPTPGLLGFRDTGAVTSFPVSILVETILQLSFITIVTSLGWLWIRNYMG